MIWVPTTDGCLQIDHHLVPFNVFATLTDRASNKGEVGEVYGSKADDRDDGVQGDDVGERSSLFGVVGDGPSGEVLKSDGDNVGVGSSGKRKVGRSGRNFFRFLSKISSESITTKQLAMSRSIFKLCLSRDASRGLKPNDAWKLIAPGKRKNSRTSP